MTDLGSSVPSPLRSQTNTGLQEYRKEAFTISHTVGINCHGPRPHVYRDAAIRQDIPMAWSWYPWSSQGPLLSLEHAMFGHPQSAQWSLYHTEMEESKFLPPAHLAKCAQAYMLILLTSQSYGKYTIHPLWLLSFKSLLIAFIFRYDSPNFFRNSRLGKCLLLMLPSHALLLKANKHDSNTATFPFPWLPGRSLFRFVLLVAISLSLFSALITGFSTRLPCDRVERHIWSPNVWIQIPIINMMCGLGQSLNPFTPVPSLVKQFFKVVVRTRVKDGKCLVLGRC